MLDVRDIRRVRRVSGDAWVVTVVLAAPSGDLHVADVTVDDAGAMTPALNADHVIDAVRRAQRASLMPPPATSWRTSAMATTTTSPRSTCSTERSSRSTTASRLRSRSGDERPSTSRASSCRACSPTTRSAAPHSSRWPRSKGSSASRSSRAAISKRRRASSPTVSICRARAGRGARARARWTRGLRRIPHSRPARAEPRPPQPDREPVRGAELRGLGRGCARALAAHVTLRTLAPARRSSPRAALARTSSS